MTRSTHVPVRITPEEKATLQRIANERSASVSSVIRWAIKVATSQDAGKWPAQGMKMSGADVSQAPGTAQ